MKLLATASILVEEEGIVEESSVWWLFIYSFFFFSYSSCVSLARTHTQPHKRVRAHTRSHTHTRARASTHAHTKKERKETGTVSQKHVILQMISWKPKNSRKETCRQHIDVEQRQQIFAPTKKYPLRYPLSIRPLTQRNAGKLQCKIAAELKAHPHQIWNSPQYQPG